MGGGIPNDEIWYTSSDGNVIELNTTAFNTEINSNTYNNGKGVIKFNGNVTSIGSYAFQDCTGIMSITIPDSVTIIERYAFSGCAGISSVKIESATPPGTSGDIFNRCTALKEILVPSASVNAYKAAKNWSNYADKIKGF